MENSSTITDANSHAAFKIIAEKSIGSSISLPILKKKQKSPYAEEKFKGFVEKKLSALYLQLLENRVSKLKRTEILEKHRLELEEKLKTDKFKAHQRKIEDQQENKKIQSLKDQQIRKILMKTLKNHSKTHKSILNQQRKEEKAKHLRIKSLFLETSRERNLEKAKVIRESIKQLETTRAESQVKFKSKLREQYLAQIQEDIKEKQEFERKMKLLESEEALLLQRIGKSSSFIIQPN